MNDLTLLYYSANVLPEQCAENVRRHLKKTVGDRYPIVSVTQTPLDLGRNINLGNIGRTYYNCYKQIFTGAAVVETPYVALVEDDTLYSVEHFEHRPTPDTFSFNGNMWYLEYNMFWRKYVGQSGMCGCICETQLLMKYLTRRFLKYPEPPQSERLQRKFQEPGRDDMFFGLPQNADTELFFTRTPLVTFNYFSGLGGKARTKAHTPIIKKNLEPWGDCDALHNKFWKGVV